MGLPAFAVEFAIDFFSTAFSRVGEKSRSLIYDYRTGQWKQQKLTSTMLKNPEKIGPGLPASALGGQGLKTRLPGIIGPSLTASVLENQSGSGSGSSEGMPNFLTPPEPLQGLTEAQQKSGSDKNETTFELLRYLTIVFPFLVD